MSYLALFSSLNEDWGFLCFHHHKTVRFLKNIWSRRIQNLELASGSCRRILPLMWIVLVSFAPCLSQELFSPHHRYLFLPQKGKEKKKQENFKTHGFPTASLGKKGGKTSLRRAGCQTMQQTYYRNGILE